MKTLILENNQVKHTVWSAENNWWVQFYWTAFHGNFNVDDIKRFNSTIGKYLLFADHNDVEKCRAFCKFMLERYIHFPAAKVSKFARSNELCLVLLTLDEIPIDQIRTVASTFNIYAFKFKSKSESLTEYDQQAAFMCGLEKYLKYQMIIRELE